MKLPYDCITFTERPCGSMASWICRQVAPACTVMVRAAVSILTMRRRRRMSMCSAPSVPICPPMLKRPPPMETGPLPPRMAAAISASVAGAITRATSMRLSCVTSLTVGPDTAPITGVFAMP